jgi:formylglycine-generating enzyme required for sulfatase activity
LSERRTPDRPGTSFAAPPTVSIPGGICQGLTVGRFELCRTPVTNSDFAPFLGAGLADAPPWWEDPAFAKPDQPVVGVTWGDAAGFAAWLSEKTGRVWRLPTEVEWQHAMSAGRGDEDPPSPWGTPVPPPGEIPEGPLAGPWPTGRGTPTAWGIFDPGTIVHEWCADWFEPSPGAPVAAAAAASSAAATRRRASRGGSWRHQVRWSRPSARSSLPPEYRYSDYGFRLVAVADDVKAR